MPPGQTGGDTSGGDLPGINVEGVSDPEGDKVPEAPFAAGRFDGLEIEVLEEELRGGEARLVFSFEFADKVFSFPHGDKGQEVEKESWM